MRKALWFMILACALALPGMSLAGTQEFGPDFCRFTIDVPDGWKSKPDSEGVQLASPDQKTSVMFLCLKTTATPEKFAEKMSEIFKGKKTTEKLDDTSYRVTAEEEKATMLVIADGSKGLVIVYGGDDKEAIKSILNSFEEK